MKEITFNEAIAMPYLMIDMVTPVKDYEKYDIHRGMKCSVLPTRITHQSFILYFA